MLVSVGIGAKQCLVGKHLVTIIPSLDVSSAMGHGRFYMHFLRGLGKFCVWVGCFVTFPPGSL